MHMPSASPTPAASLDQMRGWYQALQLELAGTVPAQQAVAEQLVITLLCGEHTLLTSAPGMAKWRLIESLARIGSLRSARLRGSEDLSAEDWSRHGWDDPDRRRGLWLIDHFDDVPTKLRNRAFAAMDEQRRETAAGRADRSGEGQAGPWVVFAARAPLGGADSSPHAPRDPRDDRFLFQVELSYPPYQDEFRVIESLTAGRSPLRPVLGPEEWNAWRGGLEQVEIPVPIIHYALRLVRATRIHSGENPDFIYEWVQEGAGPRAAEFLLRAAQARAACYGRAAVFPEDIVALTPSILRHRLVTNQNARQNGVDTDRVIRRLLTEIPQRVRGDSTPPKSSAGFTLQDWVEELGDS